MKGTIMNGLTIGFITDLSLKNNDFLSHVKYKTIPLKSNGEEVSIQIGWVRLRKSKFAKSAKDLLNHLHSFIVGF